MTVRFGTDGWRAVISDTFTFDNLRLLSQAIADAIWEEGKTRGNSSRDINAVVGFDTRFLSDRYAIEVSRVLAANGICVHLANSDASTPAVSYAVVDRGADAGVMITASHNAPRYNGVKLKARYGGSATPEQCRLVETMLSANEMAGRGPNSVDYDRAIERGQIVRFDPTVAYFTHLRRLIDLNVIAANPQRVVFDAMYGAGRGYIPLMLRNAGCVVKEIRGEMNPGFGGIHPEPIERYLGVLIEAVRQGQGNFGLATDGDADRIGAVDERGRFIDPHRVFALALRYLVEKRGQRGAVVKTVSTTRMVDRLAQRYGLPVYEVPVGFNQIADLMMTQDVLIGGEESGGISVKGHIPEGDGVLMALLLLEIVCDSGARLCDLVEDLEKDVGPAFYARRDLKLSRPVNKGLMVQRLTHEAPADIGGTRVEQVQTIDGVKYVLDGDGWLLIRPSGTEPVLRVYAEANDMSLVEALLSYGQQVAAGA